MREKVRTVRAENPRAAQPLLRPRLERREGSGKGLPCILIISHCAFCCQIAAPDTVIVLDLGPLDAAPDAQRFPVLRR